MIKLLEQNGRLYLPAKAGSMEGPKLIVCVYPAGDCDTVPWPMVASSHVPTYSVSRYRGILAMALYDAIETGDLKGPDRKVLLPDDREFDIDFELGMAESTREDGRG